MILASSPALPDAGGTTAPYPGAPDLGLAEILRRAHGLDVACYEESFLARCVEKRRAAAADETLAAYLVRLTQDRAEAGALLRSLEIHHSELFRDPLAFALLEQRLLPELAARQDAAGRPELRVWSAGCAAGQEACSVAILLAELSDGRARAVPFRIFATDRSEAQLARARRGVFPRAALARVRLGQLERWFSRQGQAYVVAPRLRERVDFSAHDLLGERTACPPASLFGDFDLVLCCNVLLYYAPASRARMLDRLRRSLASGGYLVTGEVERGLVLGAGGFQAVDGTAAVFRRAPGGGER